MTPKRLAEIEALLAALSPDWVVNGYEVRAEDGIVILDGWVPKHGNTADDEFMTRQWANCHFAAAAPAIVRELLDALGSVAEGGAAQ